MRMNASYFTNVKEHTEREHTMKTTELWRCVIFLNQQTGCFALV